MHGKKSWLFVMRPPNEKQDRLMGFVNVTIKTHAHPVHQVDQVNQEPMVKPATQASKVQKDPQVFTVVPNTIQTKSLAKFVPQVPKAHQVHQAMQDQLVQKAFQAKTVHPAKMVSVAQPAHLVQLEKLANLATMVLKDLQVKMVKKDRKAQPDRRDPLVDQAHKDQAAHLAQMENKAHQAKEDSSEDQANQVNPDPKDLQVDQANQAVLAKMLNTAHVQNEPQPKSKKSFNWFQFCFYCLTITLSWSSGGL